MAPSPSLLNRVAVDLPGRAYEIVVGADLLGPAGAEALRPFVTGRLALVVTDSHVGPLYGARCEELLGSAGARAVRLVDFPAGEASKTLATVAGFYDRCVQLGIDRESVIVALGGGVTGDMAGFLAATYMRGVDLVQVPTSLLAMVDSSVGGKNGVDLPAGKNLVGAFKQPRAVLIDLATLSTLPARELRAGLGEVVKYGAAFDPAFFAFLEEHVDPLLALEPATCARVVSRCCELKAGVVMADELDRGGARALLNYGHTFGHALETVGAYTTLLHGEAVAVGMLMAADLAARRDPSLASVVARQQALWERLGLPVGVEGLAPDAVLAAMRADKKAVRGALRLVLPERLGACRLVDDVDDAAVLDAIRGRCSG